MRNPGGYAIITDVGGGVAKERDTFTCIHCNTVVFVPVKASPADLGGWCAMCAKPLCKACVAESDRLDGKCVPFEKKLDAIERRERLLRG